MVEDSLPLGAKLTLPLLLIANCGRKAVNALCAHGIDRSIDRSGNMNGRRSIIDRNDELRGIRSTRVVGDCERYAIAGWDTRRCRESMLRIC